MNLILASSSRYRRRLLERLQIPFRCVDPAIDETPAPGEDASALAGRLALGKARAVATRNPEALVIGSDQVACVDGTLLSKPGDHSNAVRQLRASSGREVKFLTGLALVCAERGIERTHVEPFSVYFRELDSGTIERYLRIEQPYDCAGSFKCEGLGIVLFEKMSGNDPTSLEGLPLIALSAALRDLGWQIPAD